MQKSRICSNFTVYVITRLWGSFFVCCFKWFFLSALLVFFFLTKKEQIEKLSSPLNQWIWLFSCQSRHSQCYSHFDWLTIEKQSEIYVWLYSCWLQFSSIVIIKWNLRVWCANILNWTIPTITYKSEFNLLWNIILSHSFHNQLAETCKVHWLLFDFHLKHIWL